MKMTHIMLGCMCFFALASVKAQQAATTAAKALPDIAKYDMGIALKLSSNGAGAEFAHDITRDGNLVGRAYFTYSLHNINAYQLDMMGSHLMVDATIRLGSVGLLCDWHPLKNRFKITAGAAWMYNRYSVTAQLRDAVSTGVITYTPEELGTVNAIVTYMPVVPYMGIGYGRILPGKRFSVSTDIGTYFTGSPKVNFFCTNMLEPTTSQSPLINKNMKDYKWLPQLSLNVSYRITH